MAGRGAPPKPDGERQRRNEDVAEPVEMDPAGPEAAPVLEGEWPPVVERWYATWARSPQASRFLETDWQRLQMLAPLVQRWMVDGELRCLAELRLHESLLGATPGDRARNRQKVTEDAPPTVPEAPVRRNLKIVGE